MRTDPVSGGNGAIVGRIMIHLKICLLTNAIDSFRKNQSLGLFFSALRRNYEHPEHVEYVGKENCMKNVLSRGQLYSLLRSTRPKKS